MKSSLILCALLLTACCTQPEPPAQAQAASLTITQGAINGFSGQVPFTLPAIERAFEGLEVVAAADAPEPAFHVQEHGSAVPLFTVRADWTRGYVGSVSASLLLGGAPREIKSGVTTYGELRGALPQPCSVQTNRQDGPVYCEIALSSGTLGLDFQGDGSAAVLGQIAYFPRAPGP
ncbi:MAG: hypothetical protein WEA77_11860 [Hyphomonas sp.]|uniref:hypothetical protein n=1 Tax=Hyphomonas sp. TaxID=87 RepID=UPI0034A05251